MKHGHLAIAMFFFALSGADAVVFAAAPNAGTMLIAAALGLCSVWIATTHLRQARKYT
jgi:hypothetical protein